MVTGSYHPETSGANLQCRQLIREIGVRAEFVVLTTTTDAALPIEDTVDGAAVYRVYVDPQSAASKASAAMRLSAAFTRLRDRFDIVHLHGFSQKTMLVVALARAFGKHVLIKLTSFGHDDAVSMRRRGSAAFGFYRQAERFVSVAPQFELAHREAGLRAERLVTVPNGVDLDRFHPATEADRRAARRELGLPDAPVVLFVGFFSHEKRPDLLYEAWSDLSAEVPASTLVLIGPTQSTYYEIDATMAPAIRDDAAKRGLGERVVFVERSAEIERFYRAADLFALPTLREGMPNVVLEAMASGVPPIVTRLVGVTDWIVEDQLTGILVPPNDRAALTGAMSTLLTDRGKREDMARAARQSVESRFAASRSADQMLSLYHDLLAKRS